MKEKTTTMFNTRTWMALLLVLSCSMYLSVQTLHAQIQYSFLSSSGTYTAISGGTALGTTGNDDHVYLDPLVPLGVTTTNPTGPGFDIGFNFMFNGAVYDRVAISTNGWIGLGQSALTPSINLNNALGAEYSYATMVTGFAGQTAALQNRLIGFNTDLEMTASSGIRIETIGTAPARTCVIQWTGLRKFTTSPTVDNFNFQIRLNETSNTIEYVYGSFVADPAVNNISVGLRSGTDYMARTTSTAWASTTAAASSADVIAMTDVVIPGSGLTYTWTPNPYSVSSSAVLTATTLAVPPGSTNREIVKLNVQVTGIQPPLAVTSMDVSTNGTTSLTDITAVNVYYTGSSNSFSTATLFGTTGTPALSNTLTGTVSLAPGDNYFWVAYDIASGATLGNNVDAEVTSVTVGGSPVVPSVTAPAGNRIIQNPMAYISSTTTQSNITSVGRGTNNNQIIGVEVVTSTGAAINLTQLDFSANGTTDTSNIRNLKVWYTGNSNSFAATTQFGTTLPMLPGTMTFSVTGSVPLSSGTNYFWLTYDIDAASSLTNLVDAECLSATVDGIPYTPTVTAPAGTREIRNQYCVGTYTYACSSNDFINNVYTTGGSTNISNLSSGCNGNVNNYAYYPSQVLTIAKGSSFMINFQAGTAYNQGFKIYIDYDQDGVFSATEEIANATASTSMNTRTIAVPCGALTGLTRMRVRCAYATIPTDACSPQGYGETEDYDINILPNPVYYDYSTALQLLGTVTPGTTAAPVLRVPVVARGCGYGIATDFRFNTTGTTAAADIANAKLYTTGTSNVFNILTANLRGTVAAPSGAFNFSVTDTLYNNDTTNYWLVYEVAGSATIGNTLDAQFDSIEAIGAYHIPTVGNPAGNIQIDAPMSYTSSTASSITSKVGQGSTNNKIIRIDVVTSATGAPDYVTQFDFNAAGTTDTSNIYNIKVWYTGSSNVFATTTQFGSTLSNLPGLSGYNFSIAGSQALVNNTNYFWLTYDITAGATIGNVVDAEVNSITFAGTPQTPTVTAPAGSREIRAQYCTSGATSTLEEEIGQVTMSVNTVTLLNNGIGCTPYISNPLATNTYSNFSALPAMQVNKLGKVDFSICQVSNATWSYSGQTAVYIDYNQDGDFADAGEMVWNSLVASVSTNAPTPAQKQFNGSFTVPCAAALGETRMRIVLVETGTPLTQSYACGGYTWGETEDYTIEILDNPTVYQSSSAVQLSGTASPATTDLPVLRIPVVVAGCTSMNATQFDLTTIGTTVGADITTAKIYYTGNSKVFSTNNLFGNTSGIPASSFTITGTQALTGNPGDTNNFWLTYDISAGAAVSNTIDGQVTSITVGGSAQTPTVTSPAGNYVIATPMTYIGSTTLQSDTSKLGQGNTNAMILGVRVITSSTGSPINLTGIDFNANGTTDTSNIRNLKVWYTGNSKTFATNVQFGATLPMLPGTMTFSIPGNALLANDSNYFWLTYDITPGATIGNYVDAEVTAADIAFVSQTPTVTAPAGGRQIRAEYCIPVYSNGAGACTGPYYINSVSTSGAISNISNIGSGCPGTTSQYTFFSSQNLVVAKSSPFTINIQDIFGYDGYIVYIDYNQDGDFSDAGETVYSSGTIQSATGTITVPCSAATGQTRMRIRSIWFGTPYDPCSDHYNGEAEDYPIYIQDNPAVYTYSTAVQQTGTFAPGLSDVKILRIPVHSKGCGVLTVNNMYFNTTGTTNTSEITNAKLYKTGNSATFNTSKLVGTIAAPSGSFAFSVTDTLVNNDTTNYWLAYDISAGSTLGNSFDAVLDSMQVGPGYFIPTVGNPAGNVFVDAPVTYISSTVTQPSTSKVGAGTTDNHVARLELVMSATGAPEYVTSIDVATTGTTSLADITNLKIWYTGTSSSFATGNQFGSTVATPAATHTITGSMPVVAGTNYFWLTYDVASGATLTDVIDGEITSVTVASTPQIPSVTAPAGTREIRTNYCIPTQLGGSEILNVTFNTLNNTNAVAPGGYYSLLPQTGTMTTSVERGGIYDLTVTINGGTPAIGSVWIDFNNDGILTASEWQQISTNFMVQTIPIIIPMNASLGDVRMRIRTRNNGNPNGSGDACSGFGSGECEDYTITILPAPSPSTYTWNQTGTASWILAANWTPARTQRNIQDVLVFNGGGSVTANNVPALPFSTLVVDNSTTATLSGSGVNVSVYDALSLTSGKVIPTGVNLTVGLNATSTGTVGGTGSIEGALTRWVSASISSYSFPMSVGANSRAALVSYTTAPATGGKLTVTYVTGAPGTTGLPVVDAGINLVNIADAGIWRASSDGILSGGTYDVTINADGIGGVLNYTQTALLSRTNSGSAWLAVGTAVATTGSNAAMVMGRTGLTLYGEMGIAGDASNPLPVSLLSFTGTAKGIDAILSWSTASESNNKGFEVERSLDGRSFEFAGFVKGAGNSTTKLDYSLTDAKAFAKAGSNVLYYRLKQVDMDGKFTYSNVVRLQNNAEKAGAVSVYPNPFNAAYTVSINAATAGVATVKMVDLQGKVVSEQTTDVIKGLNEVSFDDINVTAGVYFVKVTVDGETQVLKLVKN